MGQFRIRAFGGMGVSGAFFGGSISTFEIQDVQTSKIAIYDCGTADGSYSPIPHLSMSVLSDWSDFPANCNLEDFSGLVMLGGGATGKDSVSFMQWKSGKAQNLHVDTSGWQISTPGIGGSVGYLHFREYAKSFSQGWDKHYALVSVWGPDPKVPTYMRYRYYDKQWAIYWGDFRLVMETMGGTAGKRSWNWEWWPESRNAFRRAMPTDVIPNASGVWAMGENGWLYTDGGGAYAQLEGLDRIPQEMEPIRRKAQSSLSHMWYTEKNGVIQPTGRQAPSIWILTALRIET